MDFLKYRYFFLTLSLVIIIAGLICGFNGGFKFDIDFKGGTNIQVDLKEKFDNNKIDDIVNSAIGQKPLVQKLGDDNTTVVSITTDTISNDQASLIVSKLRENFPNMDDPSTKNVQPSFGKELINSAIKAIVVSLVLILLYIFVRFKNLGFTAAITAVIALFHDALIIIAFYAFLRLPINSTFVAVILTIIGYSINDTVIIYDRIRENKRKITKNTDLKDTINESLTQTFRRTLYTSFTTITAILIVYIFAYINHQTVLEQFSLPLTIGVISGAYSSIFIATSLWYITENCMNKRKEKKLNQKKA